MSEFLDPIKCAHSFFPGLFTKLFFLRSGAEWSGLNRSVKTLSSVKQAVFLRNG